MSDAFRVRGRIRAASITSFERTVLDDRDPPGAFEFGRLYTVPEMAAGREAAGTASGTTVMENFDAGFQAGREEGKEECRASLQQVFDDQLVSERRRIEALLVSIHEQSEKIRRQLEQSIIKLSIVVAEQILKREVMLDDQTVIRQIRESLRKVTGVEKITVRVNPRDEALVRGSRTGMLAGADSIRDMLIEADDKVEPGGCILESDLGNIDARLSSQMKKIEEALLSRNTPAATT